MFKFTSEPGIEINGTEFRIRSEQWLDEDGEVHNSEYAFGRDGTSCAWFFVPKSERVRLESEGVKFSIDM